MATTTTNLGLTKPAGTDKIRIAQINGNMDIIDEKVGAVGNTSLQTQVSSVKTNLEGLESAVGIVVDGAKAAVAASAGQYVVLKNSIISGCDDGLYTAAQAIPANTTIDSTYLTAVSKGGLNSLAGSLSGKLDFYYAGAVTSSSSITVTLENGTRAVLIVMSSSTARCGMYYVYTTNSGGVSSYQMLADSVLTLNTSVTNKLTISSSSASSTTLTFLILSGSIS